MEISIKVLLVLAVVGMFGLGPPVRLSLNGNDLSVCFERCDLSKVMVLWRKVFVNMKEYPKNFPIFPSTNFPEIRFHDGRFPPRISYI